MKPSFHRNSLQHQPKALSKIFLKKYTHKNSNPVLTEDHLAYLEFLQEVFLVAFWLYIKKGEFYESHHSVEWNLKLFESCPSNTNGGLLWKSHLHFTSWETLQVMENCHYLLLSLIIIFTCSPFTIPIKKIDLAVRDRSRTILKLLWARIGVSFSLLLSSSLLILLNQGP